MRRMVLGLIGVAWLATALVAQGDPQPTCRDCPGTYIPRAEVEAYVQKAIAENRVDQQVRDIDIGKSHIGIGVVHRGKLATPVPESVAEHDLVSEVYHLIDGTATLAPGPNLGGKKRRPADLEPVRLYTGPGNNSGSTPNGGAPELRPGDVIVIPA